MKFTASPLGIELLEIWKFKSGRMYKKSYGKILKQLFKIGVITS